MQDQPNEHERIDVAAAGRHFIAQRRALGRKKSTLEDYESTLRIHLTPFFGDRSLGEIDVPLVEAFIYAKLEEGKAPKSIRNYMGLLHSILDHGVKRGWCDSNPAALVEKPRTDGDPDIRFLTLAELDAILDATPATPLGRVDRLVFLTAAMTGMRRGEVVAIRWQDIDWHGPPDPRPPELHPRAVRYAEVAPLEPRSPTRDPPRRRARSALRADAVRKRRRPGVRASRSRRRPRPVQAAQALPRLRPAGRRSARSLPRPPSHFRNTDGRRRRTDAGDPGVARPRRPANDADLRRLRARSEPGRPVRRASLWWVGH